MPTWHERRRLSSERHARPPSEDLQVCSTSECDKACSGAIHEAFTSCRWPYTLQCCICRASRKSSSDGCDFALGVFIGSVIQIQCILLASIERSGFIPYMLRCLKRHGRLPPMTELLFFLSPRLLPSLLPEGLGSLSYRYLKPKRAWWRCSQRLRDKSLLGAQGSICWTSRSNLYPEV